MRSSLVPVLIDKNPLCFLVLASLVSLSLCSHILHLVYSQRIAEMILYGPGMSLLLSSFLTINGHGSSLFSLLLLVEDIHNEVSHTDLLSLHCIIFQFVMGSVCSLCHKKSPGQDHFSEHCHCTDCGSMCKNVQRIPIYCLGRHYDLMYAVLYWYFCIAIHPCGLVPSDFYSA